MNVTSVKNTITVLSNGFDGAKRILSLGAKVSLQSVYEFSDCPEILRNVLTGWVVWQKRVEFSVERVVLSPHLAPQWLATLFALGAHVTFDEEDGVETVLSEYVRRTDRGRGKMTAITLPLDVPGRVWGEAHVRQTPTDESIVSAIAVLDLTKGDIRQARMALTGVWRENVRLAEAAGILLDGSLTRKRIEEVVAALQQEVSPQDEPRGSADYRRAMAAVTARRALEACIKGAGL